MAPDLMLLITHILKMQTAYSGLVMPVSLRIDVDNPFGYSSLLKKALNRLSLDYDVVPRWPSIGYLKHAREFLHYLDDKGIAATWFFRNITAPGPELLKDFKRPGYEMALHSERTRTHADFHDELRQWETRFAMKPHGFSKHGTGEQKLSRMHAKEYDADMLIEYGIREKLNYFSGNGTDFRLPFENLDGFVYIPAPFWLDNPTLHEPSVSMNDVAQYSRDKPLVVLIHPIRWVMQEDVKKRFAFLLENASFESLREQVSDFLSR
jgi:hypothetical protein